MSDIQQVRINGSIYSWASCSFLIAGSPYEGIFEINWEEKRERKRVKPARKDGVAVGETSGTYSVEGLSMKMLSTSWDILSSELTALGNGSIGSAKFTIVITQSEVAAIGVPPIVTTITFVTVDGIKNGRAEGVDEAVTELTLGARQVVTNGKTLAARVV